MGSPAREFGTLWVVLAVVASASVVGVAGIAGGTTGSSSTGGTAAPPGELGPTSASATNPGGDASGDTAVGFTASRLRTENVPPSALATASPLYPEPGEGIAFDASASTDPDGEVVEYRWDFDADGTTDRTTDDPSTTYEEGYESAGLHTTVLTVVDDDGSNDTTTASVSILSSEPTLEPMAEVETTDTGSEDVDKEYNYSISFRAGGIFTPEPGLNETLLEGESASVPVLIQFEDGIAGEQWRVLRDHGYDRERWLTATARYATLPRDELRNVSELSFVRAVTTIRPRWRLDPALAEYMGGVEAETEVRVAVSTLASVDRSGLAALAETRETGYLGTLTPDEIRELQYDDRVVWIERYVLPRPTVSQGRKLINADGATRTFPDLIGTGVRVGVLDSGIDHGHPHFSNVKIVDAKDWADGDTYPEAHPTCPHGTHVTGTITGAGENTTDGAGFAPGVAPGATPVVSRVFLADDSGSDDADSECDWVEKPVWSKTMFNKLHDKGAVVLQNSWGRDNGGQYKLKAKWVDAWAKHHQQVPIVFSNGNAGEAGSVTSPAVAKNVVSVGAVRDGSKKTVTRDQIVWTNVESKLNDLDPTEDMEAGSDRRKPEVSAPGHWTYAPEIGGDYSTGGDYGIKLGTSMAAPHVSGTAALYKQVHPNADAGEIRAALVATTNPVYQHPNQSVTPISGFGMVNVENAIFQNEYETAQNHWEDSIRNPLVGKIQTKSHTFTVDETTKQVVVVLTWHDPGHTPVVDPTKEQRNQKGKGIMVNDLDLAVGPQGDTDRYVEGGATNVRKIVVDDPEPNQWKITVKGDRVTPETTQKFDVVYRVINETSELYVPSGNSVEFDKGTQKKFTSTISGQGAPVAGIYTRLETEDPELSRCNDGVQIVGVLSDDDSADIQHCLTSNTYGDYKATMFTYSTSPGAAGDGRMGFPQIIEQDIDVHVAETQPPKSVSNLRSTDHTVGEWSNDPDIGFEWDPAEDRGPSGISHYLIRLDQSPNTIPDNAFEQGATAANRNAGQSGEWYFHVRPVDRDGNKAKPADVRHAGPYKIDLDPPEEVGSLTPEHDEFSRDPSGFQGQPVGYTNDEAIAFSWSKPSDAHSGLEGYNISVYNVSTKCDTKWGGCLRYSVFQPDEDETSVDILSDEGLYTVVIGSVDVAGNENVTSTLVFVDRTAPTARVDVGTGVPTEDVPVSFNASDSFDKGGLHEFRWYFGDNETATTASPSTTHTYENPGTHLARVEVFDRSGNSANASVLVDVGNATVEGSVVPVGFSHRETYDDLEAGQWYPRDVPTPGELYRRIAGARIALNPDEPIPRLDLAFAIVDDRPDRVAPLPQILDVEEGSPYFFVAHTQPYSGQTRLDFTVSGDTLEALDVPPAAVRLYRSAGTDWQAVETRRLAATDTGFRYRGEFSGLSLFAVGQAELVSADVKPGNGNETDPINPKRPKNVPVVIHTTEEFDASTVNVSSLRFGAPEAVNAGRGATPAHGGHLEDVDDDGDRDLVVHFEGEMEFDGDATTAHVVGSTAGGVPVFGSDSIRIVGE